MMTIDASLGTLNLPGFFGAAIRILISGATKINPSGFP
jgi:hypothetical protein